MQPFSKTAPLLFAILLLLSPALLAQSFTGTVVEVTDGDTLDVNRGGTVVTVRLHGVDAPEGGQPYGAEATQLATRLSLGKRVSVEVVERDRYGRSVGVVLLPDGTELNADLVRRGLAWWYERYAPDRIELLRLQQEARREERGLWASSDPIAPWDWRQK